ncbi:MAG: hypothetical protein ACI4O8_06230, partial [Aristaeellaceae bacterium]
FKTSALNHSAISPDRTSEIYYTRVFPACQPPDENIAPECIGCYNDVEAGKRSKRRIVDQSYN